MNLSNYARFDGIARGHAGHRCWATADIEAWQMLSSHWLRAFETHGGEIFVRGKSLMERRELTPDCQPIGALLSAQRREVRELVSYLLVMGLVDAHKAKIRRANVVNRQHYLTIEPVSGSRFAVRRPPISMAAELRLREVVKRVL